MDAEGCKVLSGGWGGFLWVGLVVDVEGAEPQRIALLDKRADILITQETGIMVLGKVGELHQLAIETDVKPTLGVCNRSRSPVLHRADLPEPVENGLAHVFLARC